MGDRDRHFSRSRFPATLAAPAILVPNRASFPRTLPPVNPHLATVAEGSPFPNVYDPPVAPALPAPPISPVGVTTSREVGVYQSRCLDVGSILNPTPVFSTDRSWRGIDVFVSTDFLSGANLGFLTVLIYAVTRNVGRVLVGSGRTRATFVNGLIGSVRIASAAAACDSFDVVLSRSSSPAAAAQTVSVTCVARNDVTVDTYDHYAHTSGGIVTPFPDPFLRTNPLIGPVTSALVPAELVALQAVNGAAFTRFLMVWDQATVPVAADVPVYSFAVPAGQSIFVDSLALRARRYVQGFLTAGPSDAFGSYVVPGAADFRYNMWFR